MANQARPSNASLSSPRAAGLSPRRGVAISLCLCVLILGCASSDPTGFGAHVGDHPLDGDGDGWTPPEDCLDEGHAWASGFEPCDESQRIVFAPADGTRAKDFSVVFDEDRLHLFHIRHPGPLGQEDHETSLGHVSSSDLRQWTTHESVVGVGPPGNWNDTAVWAPHVFEAKDRWYMFVTGVRLDDEIADNRQRIGIFTSTDLFEWTPVDRSCDGVEGVGCVLECVAPFTAWGSDMNWGSDCRDGFVLPRGDDWLMFVTVRLVGGDQAVAVARSANLMEWKMVTWIPQTEGHTAESPTAIWRDGVVHLLWTSREGVRHLWSATPLSGEWEGGEVVHRNFAGELLDAGDDSWYYPSIDGNLQVEFQRMVFGPQGLEFTQVVAPECRIPAARIHPGASDVVDGIDNDCDGRIDPVDPAEELSTRGAESGGPGFDIARGRF